jgi:hypothetical protein
MPINAHCNVASVELSRLNGGKTSTPGRADHKRRADQTSEQEPYSVTKENGITELLAAATHGKSTFQH